MHSSDIRDTREPLKRDVKAVKKSRTALLRGSRVSLVSTECILKGCARMCHGQIMWSHWRREPCVYNMIRHLYARATQCNTLQHAATRCNT